ncbi:hypothetical protein [Thalassotalea piscium]|uniref:Uncharacterized protein n=1 Tax=Thalassotalea piscium TaxID=1230533 RepID=A0A7X0NGT7_9GAMM|nr:hypothetical protein [Thalassotalea piscium]MBB6543036.1 hypothetical protein [Thalassotalea piscium]
MAKDNLRISISPDSHMTRVILGAAQEDTCSFKDFIINHAYKNILREAGINKTLLYERKYIEGLDHIETKPNVKTKAKKATVDEEVKSERTIEGFKSNSFV